MQMLVLAGFLGMPVGTAVLGLTMWVAGFPLALMLSWTSVKVRTALCYFIVGLVGTVAGFLAVKFLFISLSGAFPIWAGPYWLVVPVINILRKRREMISLNERHKLIDHSGIILGEEEAFIFSQSSQLIGMLLGYICAEVTLRSNIFPR
jgi:hypothetical protein